MYNIDSTHVHSLFFSVCNHRLYMTPYNCYKNICCWHGPYSFSFSSLPSTFTLRTICAYTCTISSGWLYFPLIFSGYTPFDHFLAHLYYACFVGIYKRAHIQGIPLSGFVFICPVTCMFPLCALVILLFFCTY
jgi:hypothetical protein